MKTNWQVLIQPIMHSTSVLLIQGYKCYCLLAWVWKTFKFGMNL
jgi:hypothetical protein